MKIVDINYYLYNQSFRVPITTPKVHLTSRKALIIEMITSQGKSFFGECNAFESDWYDSETINSVQKVIEAWSSSIKNKEFSTFDAWLPYLNQLNAAPAARATVVMAVFQMYQTLPIINVDYGATVSGLTEAHFVQLKETQPKRIKIKWSNHILKDLAHMNKQLDFEYQLVIDANESLTKEDLPKLALVKQYHPIYIEEPFKTMDLYKNYKHNLFPPVAIDEKATSVQQILTLCHSYNIQVVVIKPFRMGGIDHVIKLIHKLQRDNISVVIGGMYEYGLSRYFTAYLAQFGDYPGDITPSGYYYDHDLVSQSGILKQRRISFSPPVVDTSQLVMF